jgi:hypothetical protein
MICPTCGVELPVSVRYEYVHAAGREVAIRDGWDRCEDCDQDVALDRMRQRTPWLFRQDGAVDEHDVMQQMERRGIDGWPVVR